MLILNSRKAAYVHLEKCGGTSIETALSPFVQWNDIILGSTPFGEQMNALYGAQFGLKKHMSAVDARRLIGASVWDRYYTFATIRNPYHLALSLFTFSLQECDLEPHASQQDLLAVYSRMIEWNKWPKEWPFYWNPVRAAIEAVFSDRPFLAFLRSDYLKTDAALTSQFDRLSIDCELVVKDVFRMEEIDLHWPRICDRLGVGRVSLPHINRSQPLSSNISIGDDEREVIRARFEPDFSIFYPDAEREIDMEVP